MNIKEAMNISKWSLNAKIASAGMVTLLIMSAIFIPIIKTALDKKNNTITNISTSKSNSISTSNTSKSDIKSQANNSLASSKAEYEWVMEDVGGEYVLPEDSSSSDKITTEIIDWNPGAPGYGVTYTVRMFLNEVPINFQEVEIKTVTPGVTITGAKINVSSLTRKNESNCKIGIRLKKNKNVRTYITIPLYNQKEVTFADEFNGTTLDPLKWAYYEENQISSHPGASKQIVCNREAVKVENGNLVLTAKKKKITTHTGDAFDYITGHITGRNKFSQFQGTFSGRFKFPTKGGVNSAFWLLPFSYRTDAFFMAPNNPLAGCNEIDIFEHSKYFEKNGNSTTSMGQHYFLPGNVYSHASSLFPSLQQQPSLSDNKFHDVALVWTTKGTYYYFDGKLLFKEEGIKPSNTERTDAYMILTTGVASVNNDVNNWYGTMLDSDFPQSFVIDYIKVYK